MSCNPTLLNCEPWNLFVDHTHSAYAVLRSATFKRHQNRLPAYIQVGFLIGGLLLPAFYWGSFAVRHSNGNWSKDTVTQLCCTSSVWHGQRLSTGSAAKNACSFPSNIPNQLSICKHYCWAALWRSGNRTPLLLPMSNSWPAGGSDQNNAYI